MRHPVRDMVEGRFPVGHLPPGTSPPRPPGPGRGRVSGTPPCSSSTGTAPRCSRQRPRGRGSCSSPAALSWPGIPRSSFVSRTAPWPDRKWTVLRSVSTPAASTPALRCSLRSRVNRAAGTQSSSTTVAQRSVRSWSSAPRTGGAAARQTCATALRGSSTGPGRVDGSRHPCDTGSTPPPHGSTGSPAGRPCARCMLSGLPSIPTLCRLTSHWRAPSISTAPCTAPKFVSTCSRSSAVRACTAAPQMAR